MQDDNPILNCPYDEPVLHYATDDEGALDYARVIEGRRIHAPEIQAIPVRQSAQGRLLEINDFHDEYGTHLINLTRKEVSAWRDDHYPGTTRISKDLLTFWFENPDRHAELKLFFAQREAIETAIWLNEVAEKSNAGQHILNRLEAARKDGGGLPRTAFKMATGTGKTVVMAALILYHYMNRREYRSDTRFADYFLVVAPGITIKNRLAVLFVDTKNKTDIQDYYHQRWLIPHGWEDALPGLNARIVVTNYHSFELRTLQGNKRSPFDGKLDAEGNKQEGKEDPRQMLRRVLGKFKPDTRLLIINDEAHHCYLPRQDDRKAEGEDTKDENARAAVWYNGLLQVAGRFKVEAVYDLSATPYYLTGSGYEPYSLFGWVVSDFGLIEAIESGLVKIPFLPESDDTQELDMPVLKNLYQHVKKDLPKKGQKRKKAEARKKGETLLEDPPKLPPKVKLALEQFYKHYKDDYDRVRELFDNPPVFIVVCNNTSVSKEVYKYVAGYERAIAEDGTTKAVAGKYPLFSNYDEHTGKPLHKAPTLLIDSSSLEDSDQINEDFKQVFASEIQEFKREYARVHGAGAAERITDAQILREVVNTVGKTGMLGSHLRCVVSVSMLTEGWDANTVTHIMGLRAFNSQLLCEQVAGRALRRKVYRLQSYDKDGNIIPEENRKRYKPENIRWKFPPEYAHIIGVPFKLFKGGKTQPPPPVDLKQIKALPEREAEFEITFPNVEGYRVESREGAIRADFSEIEIFEIGPDIPTRTEMGTAVSGEKQELTLDECREMRDRTVIYKLTKEVLARHYSDDDGYPEFQKFNQLMSIVREWYDTRVRCYGDAFKQLLYFFNPEKYTGAIVRAIQSQQQGTDIILPILNFYNSFGSTKYVHGATSRPVFETTRSHVNYVVADTDSWEQIAAKTLEDLGKQQRVLSYVKNAFLGFTIPYVKDGEDKPYYPDFIARCRRNGDIVNLVIEVTGMNKDKAEKTWYVKHRWLPAVNAVREKYGYDEWDFIEIAGDIRDIKNQLLGKISEVTAGREAIHG